MLHKLLLEYILLRYFVCAAREIAEKKLTSSEGELFDLLILFSHSLPDCVVIMHSFIYLFTSDKGGGKCVCPQSFVYLCL